MRSEHSSQTADFAPIFWILIGAIFIVAVNTQVMNPVLPAVAGSFDASVGRAGLAVTAYFLPYGVFQLIYGPIADRVGRVNVIAVTLGASAAGTLLCALSPSLLTLIIFRALTGAAAAPVTSLTLTYIGDTVPYQRRHQAIGYSAMALSLGIIVAAAMGGFLSAIFDWRAIFLIIAIVSAVITVMILREPATRVRMEGEPGGFLEPFRIALADRRHLFFYLLIAIEGLTVFGSLSFFGFILRERDDFSYVAIGLILPMLGLASMFTGRYLGAISRQLSETRMVLVGGVVATAGYGIFALAPVIPFGVLALAMVGAGYTLMHTTFQTRATELLPSARATGMTVFAFALFIGSSAGSVVLSQAFEHSGFTATLLGLAVATLLFGMLASHRLLEVSRPHADEAVRYTEPA